MEFRHQTITTPVVTPEDHILHGITTLTNALTDAPMAHLYAQRQAIAALRDAYNSWATPNERPDPVMTISRHIPSQIRRAMKILDRNLKQPAITHHPDPRVRNKMSRCEPDPRRKNHQHVPAPSPRVNSKETSPEVQTIARRTRSHTQNTQPPIALHKRSQLQQALKFTPSQAA